VQARLLSKRAGARCLSRVRACFCWFSFDVDMWSQVDIPIFVFVKHRYDDGARNSFMQ